MLERLAAGWAGCLPGGVWSETGVRFPRPGGNGEMDVVALLRRDGNASFLLGECKRNPDRHSPADLLRRVANFGAALGDARQETAMREAQALPMIVSPVFAPEQRQAPLPDGVRRIGIRDMAACLGFGPGSKPAPSPRSPDRPEPA